MSARRICCIRDHSEYSENIVEWCAHIGAMLQAFSSGIGRCVGGLIVC